jgi:hypothetical protein
MTSAASNADQATPLPSANVVAAQRDRRPWHAMPPLHEQEPNMAATRRELLAGWPAMTGAPGTAVDGAAAATVAPPGPVRIDPTPLFPISPLLHMQFMEPLGTTDTGVEAAWDHDADDWRPDFVETVRDLAPKAIRWGGLMSRYYKWREGVGPAAARPPMRNHVWGGWETNRVGTAAGGQTPVWRFPAGSVSAVELDLA